MLSRRDRWFWGFGLGFGLTLWSFALPGLSLEATESASGASATATVPSLVQAIGLGIVQGLTEFLPISSTGHLIVISRLCGWGMPSVALTAILELGSVAAVISYFWADLRQLGTDSLKAGQTRQWHAHAWQLTRGIGLGTLPIIGFGLLVKKLVPDLEHSALRSLPAIAIASILMALLLGVAEWLGQHHRGWLQVRSQDGIWMGVAQAFAVIPGISRSGSTLTAGLFLGLERATAARFSFLLAIPAITLAGLLGVIDLLSAPWDAPTFTALLLGGITSAGVSYAAIGWLLHYLQTRTTWIFVWYRLAFGLLILALTLTQTSAIAFG